MRAGAGFRMALETKRRHVGAGQALDRLVKQ